MKDRQKITHNGVVYIYDEFYDRLDTDEDVKWQVLCPKCMSSMFSISYGYYDQCIANCVCGHSFTIYD